MVRKKTMLHLTNIVILTSIAVHACTVWKVVWTVTNKKILVTVLEGNCFVKKVAGQWGQFCTYYPKLDRKLGKEIRSSAHCRMEANQPHRIGYWTLFPFRHQSFHLGLFSAFSPAHLFRFSSRINFPLVILYLVRIVMSNPIPIYLK